MKNFLNVVLAVFLIMFPVLAIADGSAVFNQQVTLYSAATGTTGAVKTNAFTFDRVMNNLACDFITGVSSGTSNVTFVLSRNQGSSTSLFDTGTVYGIASFTLASSTTLTVMASKAATAGQPFRTIQATITSPTTTQVITVNCSASQ